LRLKKITVMTDGLRVGLVGCGVIARSQHIPALLRISGAKIAAVCDKDPGLLATLGRKLRSVERYEDFGEMLSRAKLDVVDICTPPQTHAALGIQAAESGRHVLVEKPAALSLEEFDRLTEACQGHGVRLCQIQNKMFEPVVRRALSEVQKGNIGNVAGVDIKVLLRRTAALYKDPSHWCHELPAGLLTETLPHPIYIIQAFLGAVEPVAVHVTRPDLHGHVGSYEIIVVLEGRRGVGVVAYSGSSPQDKVVIDVHGTRKSLRIDLWNSALLEYGIGGAGRASRGLENLRQGLSLLACTASAVTEVATGRFRGGHLQIIDEFLQSVRNGTDSPVSVQQAREVIRVLEGITGLAAANRANIP
jgi:predicted dehydrogenase